MENARDDAPSPVYTSLASVYADALPDAEQRFGRLRAAFSERYGALPSLYARAPGRVNLIGEHIDYEGYSVLPMAIALDTIVAVRLTDTGRLRVSNTEASYGPVSLPADPAQVVDVASHSWATYVLCGYKGAADHCASVGASFCATGMDVVVDGRVPRGGGLSSSSALVCASVLAVLAAQRLSPPARQVAELACACERYCGTQSGGMDQAISLLGQPGLAKLVSFNPVRTEDVKLPPGCVFVVANSLAVSTKAVTAAGRYNARVVECRLAAAALGLALGLPPADAAALRTLRQLKPLVAPEGSQSVDGDESSATGACLAAAKARLHGGAYTPAELCASLRLPSLATLFADSPASLEVLSFYAASGKGFALRDRAEHVFSEALRVRSFAAVCAVPPPPPPGAGERTADPACELGALMDASHASCRDLYECSCAELDELVGCCKAAGALGARLTGAGWGGCVVALVRETEVAPFLASVRSAFFAPRASAAVGDNPGFAIDDVLFATKPSAGAALFTL